LVITTSLYVGVAVVLTGMVNSSTVNTLSPLASAFKVYPHFRWAVIIIAVGSLTTLTASVLASLFGQPRIFFQMAVDGLLFKPFGWVNKRGVIYVSTIVTLIVAGTLALFYDLDKLSHMISAGTLLAYATVCAGVILLRYKPVNDLMHDKSVSPLLDSASLNDNTARGADGESYFQFANGYTRFVRHYLWVFLAVYLVSSGVIGLALKLFWYISFVIACGIINVFIYVSIQIIRPTDIPKTFKCPLVPLVPLGGLLINTLLFASLDAPAIYRVLAWSGVGGIIYLFYGVRNSKLNKTALPKVDS